MSWSCDRCGGDRESEHGSCMVSDSVDAVAGILVEIRDELRKSRTDDPADVDPPEPVEESVYHLAYEAQTSECQRAKFSQTHCNQLPGSPALCLSCLSRQWFGSRRIRRREAWLR